MAAAHSTWLKLSRSRSCVTDSFRATSGWKCHDRYLSTSFPAFGQFDTSKFTKTRTFRWGTRTFFFYLMVLNEHRSIFVMPPGTSIPLHNHPQMTVISRVLYGSMQVNAFDLVAPEIDEEFWRRKEERIRNAELKHNRFPRFRPRHLKVAVRRNTELVHGPTTIELLPDRCNIHEFVAVGDVGCAIFDILTPGYNPLAGRDCTYYRALLQVEGGTEDEPWHVLEPSNLPPSSFVSVDLPYHGPALTHVPVDDSSEGQSAEHS
ncbi:hypothetical protein, variant 1 [Aphanomyces invadans]|uniref:Uncharacterized protein n=1 Tax=Aphanomyces invadans TaxID=157072 RepID=A0A024UQY8_9STRA|nr:hypothetical protein, variant 1 [Aphanomyces invadans]ETW08861.1 hypothetical protein, variant 1 [Aphanomyces invadans]|eukprot:XP_008862666.1 hypothetical protein, variant 1 [Aphanomyces invadans]